MTKSVLCSARGLIWFAASLCALMVGTSRSVEAQGLGLADLRHMMDWGNASLILFDQLEYAPTTDDRPISLDAIAWYGGARNRLWLRAEGEQLTATEGGEGEIQLSYGRLITPFFDALAGVRVDQTWGEKSATRAHLALGLAGLAPGRFEFSPSVFLSQDGDLSGRVEAEYQVLITQQLIAAPEVGVDVALQDVPEWGVGSGIGEAEAGLRLRYEFRREFAPYLGYSWSRRFGETARLAREHGESVTEGALVAGIRIWR